MLLNIELISYLFFYLLSLSLMFNFNSVILFWVMLELNLIFFIMILNVLSTSPSSLSGNMEASFYYLVVQCIGSLIFLMSFVYNSFFDYLFMDADLLVAISMLLKLGIFPLQGWMFSISKFIPMLPLFLLLTIQKLPTMIFLFSFSSLFLLGILFLNLFMGSFFLFYSHSLKDLLISSSIYSMVWFFLFFIISPIFLFIFFLNYLIFSFQLLKLDFNYYLSPFNTFELIFIVMGSMFFLGLPPMGMFFFKFFSIFKLIFILDWFPLLFLWIITFVSTVGYFKFFYSYFIDLCSIFIQGMNTKKTLFFIFFINFFLFVI